jgi:hypothetical protein
LREVFCLVTEFREEKRTFTKVEGGNVDFFLYLTSLKAQQPSTKDIGSHLFSMVLVNPSTSKRKGGFYLNASYVREAMSIF